MKRYLKTHITDEQKHLIWYYFNDGGDNRTSTISKKVGVSYQLTSLYIQKKIDEKMERIDKEVNERYNQRIKSEKSKELENEMLKEFSKNFKDS